MTLAPSWATLNALSERLAPIIRDEIFDVIHERKTTVFLCGKGLDDKESRRAQIASELSRTRFGARYDLLYPEQVFDELLREDLLDLENQLASSVDVVILVLESAGAIAELGAFANHERLRNKLLCIIDSRYRRDRSFINAGPIKHLRRNKAGHTLYVKWDNISEEMTLIRKWIATIAKRTDTRVACDNLIHSHDFVLPCVFLFEPVHKSTLCLLVQHAGASDEKTANTAVTAAVSRLLKQRLIVRVPCGGKGGGRIQHGGPSHVYRLTDLGLSQFESRTARLRKSGVRESVLDSLRLSVLEFSRRYDGVMM